MRSPSLEETIVSVSMEHAAADDWFTLTALGISAFALADVSHEALGHGLATLAVGDKAVFLCTCYFDSNGDYSKWIPASGGLMNLAVGLGALVALHFNLGWSAAFRYFLVLTVAFNLFWAFGYPAASGISRFGDWAAVISGLEAAWLWRVFLVLVSVVGYYASMILLSQVIAPSARSAQIVGDTPLTKARLQRITFIPYVAAIILAGTAAAFNPKGWLVIFTSGIPSAAAAFGLTQMDHFVSRNSIGPSEIATEPIGRSLPWIFAGLVVTIFFVGVLGPGIRFR